jgi:RNA polymerase sigma-70 factor, ECF subfamily
VPNGMELRRNEGEADLVAAARRHDESAIRTLIRQHNRMLFRLTRSILRDDDEAEDAVQATYVKAFTHLASYRGDSSFGTWLGRIALNEALGRARRERPSISIDRIEGNSAEIIAFPMSPPPIDPERSTAEQQMKRVVEHAIDELPPSFRTVLVARLVEGLSVEETAELLDLRPETVKTRLHRARALLRGALEKQLGPVLQDVFPFGGERCQRIAGRVVQVLRDSS